MGSPFQSRSDRAGRGVTRSVLRRRAIACIVAGAAALALPPAWGQSFLERLIGVLRDRVQTVIPGALPGTGNYAVPTPEYVAEVLRHIEGRNQAEMADLRFMGTTGFGWTPTGTAIIVIDIDPSGRVIDVQLAQTTGQGRISASKAVDAIRRSGPFGPPRGFERNAGPIRVAIDETLVFNSFGQWTFKSFVDAMPPQGSPGG